MRHVMRNLLLSLFVLVGCSVKADTSVWLVSSFSGMAMTGNAAVVGGMSSLPIWAQESVQTPAQATVIADTYEPISPDIGAIAADAGVSGGQASYNLSIPLPPGRAGMQPQVVISYNSQQGNGVLGVGFSLGAAGAISRCPATLAQDGFLAGVSYSPSYDRLCLDGARLMAVYGTYGQAGTIYRTELDQFTRVTQLGGNLNQSWTSFKVEYSNSQTAIFGSSDNTAKVIHYGRAETFSWLLNYQHDATANNVIHYNYRAAGAGEVILASIKYTGNSKDVQGNREVIFDYEGRPDSSRGYIAGGLSEQTVRLKSIKTSYASTVLQLFQLQYVQSQTSKRSIIRNITQCGYQNGSQVTCLRPTEFDWLEAEQTSVLQPLNFGAGMAYPNTAELSDILPRGDVNGDGVRDWPGRYVNAEGEETGSHNVALKPCYKNFYLLKIPTCTDSDFNLDGLTDDWRISDNGQLQIKYTGANWFSTNISLDKSTQAGLLDSYLAHVADYNGDGWPDLMVYHHNAGWPQLKLYLHTKANNAPYTSSQLVFSYRVFRSGGTSALQDDIQFMGDMTGNGRPDLIQVNTGAGSAIGYAQPVPVALLKNATEAGAAVSFNKQTLDFGFTTLDDTFSYFIDLNGDGLPDWVGWTEEADRVGFGYRKNLGNGVFSAKTLITGASLAVRGDYFTLPGDEPGVRYVPKYAAALKVHDMNHDGIPELLVPGARLLQGCTNISTARPAATTSLKCGEALYGHYYQTNQLSSKTSINSAALDDSIYQFDAIYFDTAMDGTITTRKESTSLIGHAYESVIIDAYGTGLPSLLFNHRLRPGFSFSGSAAGTAFSGFENKYGVYFNRNFGTGSGNSNSDYQPVDYLQAVTDGLSKRSEWRYRPLSTGEMSAGLPLYETANHYQGGGYFHFASSMYVVQSFQQANGVGSTNETQFAYKGAMYHLQGRGFRGFRSIISKDMRTDLITHTDFRQKFPFSGQVRGQFVFHAIDYPVSYPALGYIGNTATGADAAISVQVNNWQLNTVHSNANSVASCTSQYQNFTDETDLICPAGGIYNIYLAATGSYQRDLLSKQQYSQQQSQVTDIDAFGNVLKSSHSTIDDSGIYRSSTDSVYSVQTGTVWAPHRLQSNTQHSAPVQQQGTVLSYPAALDTASWVKTIYSNWHASGAPQQLATEASDGSQVQTVLTSYNIYGLPLTVTRTANVMSLSGTWAAQSRKETILYSNNGSSEAVDGYFPYKLTNALGHISYNLTDAGTGQSTQQIAASGVSTTFTYDVFGRPATVLQSGKSKQTIVYDGVSSDNNAPETAVWMSVTMQAGSPQQRRYFDLVGREVRSSVKGFSGDWVNQDTEYNVRGLVERQSTPYIEGGSGGETLYADFDALGRPGSKQAPGGLSVTYRYDRLTTDISANNQLHMRRSYNTQNKLLHTEDAKGGLTYYRYNGLGLPIVLQDANGVQLTATYNALGQKLTVQDPNQGNSSFIYNGFGELEQEIDANGLTIRLDYDLLGRQISRNSYSGSTLKDSAAFSFDTLLKGFPYQESANGVLRTFGYDAVGNLTSNTLQLDGKSFTNRYFYHSNTGQPTGMRYPNGISLQYGYNAQGYLNSISNLASGYVYQTINSQNASGNVLEATLGNGVREVNQYDEATGWVQRLTASLGSTSLHHVEYSQYDVYGNIRQVRNHATGAQEYYDYDELHRLTNSTYVNLGYTIPNSYSYDAVGNLLSKTDYANTYRYGNASKNLGGNAGANAVRQVVKLNNAVVNFSYDNQGNLTSGDGLSIQYNSFKQPTQIQRGTHSFNFTYGANLERVKEQRNGLTTYEIDKLYEEESNGNWRLYIGKVAIINYDATSKHQLRYTHQDRLGSSLTYTDHNGQVTDRRMFDAFGKPRATDGNNLAVPKLQNPLLSRNGFTDHRHLDEVELIHMNGRAYDYNLGRFLSVDPVIQSPGDSQSINPYSYLMNNPMAGTDPTGYCAAATGTRIKDCGDMKVEVKADGKTVSSTVVKNVNFKNGADVNSAMSAGAGQIGRAFMDIGAPKEVSGSGARSPTGNSTSKSTTANGRVTDSIKGVANAGLGSLKKGGLLGVGLTPMLTASDEEMEALAMPIMAANRAEHEEIQAAALSRVRTTGGGIVLYHGTDVQSALRLLNGEPLSAQVASGNKIDGLPGFYLATDYDDAVFFAARRGEGAVIQFIISNKALGGLNANGAYFQKIPVGGFRADGYEYLVPPQAFGAFNTFRNGKEIVVTP